MEDVEAIEEILAEAARADLLAEILVRRGDDADVAFQRAVVADRRALALLEEAEELDLERERQLADLVEEQRPALRGGDAAPA